MSSNISFRTLCAATVILFTAGMLAAAPQEPQSLEGKTAGQAFKNIQVLKDIPANQLFPTMHFISASLGVECEFCHVQGDFSKDDKDTKKTARKMLTMMFGINKDSFEGRPEVSCYTCHHGGNDPQSVPIAPEIMSFAPEPPKPGMPSVDAILSKYVAALGGEQAIRGVHSRVIESTAEIEIDGAEKPDQDKAEHYEKAPNLSAVIVHTPKGVTSFGFDGTTSWSQNPKGVVREAAGRQLERARRNANFYESLDLQSEYTRMNVRGIEKIGDREAYLVVGRPQNDLRESLYFDTQSGLLLRKVVLVPTPVGNAPTQVDYEDYRDAGNGVKVPFVLRINNIAASQREIIRVQSVRENTPIEDGKFAKPASATESSARP